MKSKSSTIVKLQFLSLLIFFFIGSNSFAQDKMNLPQILELSLKENFDIQIAKTNTQIAQTQNTLGKAGFLPQVYLTIGDRWSNSNRNNPTSFINGKIISNSLSPTIGFEQMVFNGFAAQISKDNYDQLQALSSQNGELIVLNNVKAVYLSYYQIQSQYVLYDNQVEVLALSQKVYDYNKQKWETGLITKQELNTFYGFLLEDSVALLSLQSQVLKLEGDLSKLCGVEKIKVVKESLPTLLSTFDRETLTSALDQNPMAKSILINQRLKENELNMAKIALYPQLSVNGGYSYSRSNFLITGRDPVIGTTKDFYLGFSVNYNLFNGFKTQTNIELAKLNVEIQGLKNEQVTNRLQTDLGVYLDSYEETFKQHEMVLKLLGITESTLSYWQEKQKMGLITSLELRNYQKNYLLNQNLEVNHWLKAFQNSLEIQTLTNQLVYPEG